MNYSSQESDCIIGRKKIQFSQMPISMQSPSDLKPPTINSSLISNLNPYSDVQRNSELQKNGQYFQSETPDIRLIDETETKRMKKSNFHKTRQFIFQPPLIITDILNKKIILKFINILKQKAYIYNDNIFNTLQKSIMTEKYIEFADNNQTKSFFNKLDFFYYLFWDTIIVLLNIMLLFWLIFKIGYNDSNNQFFQLTFIIFISIDVLLQLFSPIIQQGQCIFNKMDILKNQLNYIIINLLYAITSIALIIQTNNSKEIIILLTLQIITSIKKLNYSFNKLSDFINLNFNLISQIGSLLLLTHICCCLWYFISISNENSWIYILNLDEKDNLTKYCYTINITLSLLLNQGYNVIQFETNTDLIFSSILIFLSIWIFCFFIVNIKLNLKHSFKYQYKLIKQSQIINDFFSKRNISMNMKARVRNYFKYLHLNQKNEQEVNIYIVNIDKMQKMIQSLPSELKEDLILQLRMHALQKCKTLQKFSNDTFKNVTLIMEPLTFEPNQIIQDQKSLYIIEIGKVEIKEYNKQMKILEQDDSFGIYGFYSGLNSQTIYQTLEFTQLYKIDSEKFYQIIQQNKVDHERFMYMKHSIIQRQYNIVKLFCYSCNSNNHLINNCPLINYKPEIEKIHKYQYYHDQDRINFNRDKQINMRVFNRRFKRLPINYDALKMFRLKYDYENADELDEFSCEILENDSEEESETESEEQYASNQMLSDNRITDKQDGTIVSIIKQPDQIKENSRLLMEIDENQEEMFIIRQNNQKTTVNTAQFQFEQQQLQQSLHQQQQQQQQQQYRFSLMPIDPKIKWSQSSQLEQTSSQLIQTEGQIQQQQSRNSKNNNTLVAYKGEYSDKIKMGSQNKISSYISVENKAKKNLTRIKEEDCDTLNLSNRYNSDELSSQNLRLIARQSQNSLPSRNTVMRPSMKRFSSKISSINQIHGSKTFYKTNNSPFTRSFQNIPTQGGLVDLSMYKNKDKKNEDFENMYQYRIYFPLGNYNNIITRLNYYLKWKMQEFVQSKYTFQYHVKLLTTKFNTKSCLEMNPDIIKLNSKIKPSF